MNNELLILLIGNGGLALSVFTYFAGVYRTEARHRKEDKGQRINRVLDAYLKLLAASRSSGLGGLQKAGVAILATDAEIRELGELITAHGQTNPLTIESGILNNIDLKKFFDYAARERVNFLHTPVADVIQQSEVIRGMTNRST